MRDLYVRFENCYGIRSLEYTFDFSQHDAYSIYAPNGFMKTSFAKTFNDYALSRDSKDEVFVDRTTGREIQISGSVPFGCDNIFVIEPYIDDFDSKEASSLLVHNDLKRKFEEAVRLIEEKFGNINKALKKLSGISSRTTTPVDEIMDCYEIDSERIYDFFNELAEHLNEEGPFPAIRYTEVFNPDTMKVLSKGTIREMLHEYIEKYNELIDSSEVLSQQFNHYNASTVTKSLKDHGFFRASHSVNINRDGEKSEVINDEELGTLFEEERLRLFDDPDLKRRFDKVDKALSNAGLRRFRDYLFDNRDLLPELENHEDLKKKIWYSYFYQCKQLITDFAHTYQASKAVIDAVVESAKTERTDWENVVRVFNERFDVPFNLAIQNQHDVILKGSAPIVVFEFSDIAECRSIEKPVLMRVLSRGERRALYILNLLFEIEAREKRNLKTLLIIDDIADSFDYKNKYAIIEYLKHITKADNFKAVFLTHNFDFHRTVSSRIGLPRTHRLSVYKRDDGLEFAEEFYQNNPFEFWRKNLDSSERFLAAYIPFVRNLAEYCKYEDEYNQLTSLLHIKPDTNTITLGSLKGIIESIVQGGDLLNPPDPSKRVIDVIISNADELVRENASAARLEDKVTLSIAIRLQAEKFMIARLADDAFVRSITASQTMRLYEAFCSRFPTDTKDIKVLDQVNSMTPENIHLNSFMYEPILDMSGKHLYALYTRVRELLNQI